MSTTNYWQSLEFVRAARKGDPKDIVKSEGTLWRDDSGEDIWLTPQHIQQHRLTDKMRQALEARPQELWDQDPMTDTAAEHPVVVSAQPRPGLTGGHNDRYRWDFLQDGDDLWILVDNRPAIDAAVKAMEPPPDLERIKLPWDVYDVIHGQVLFPS